MSKEERGDKSPEEEAEELEELDWEAHEAATHATRGWPDIINEDEEVGEDDPEFEEVDSLVWDIMEGEPGGGEDGERAD